MRRNNELSLKRALHAMFKRDCLHYLHKPSQIINPLLFFFMITASIPFAIDTNEFQLRLIGPGLIWIMAILSYMLTLNQLYENDLKDGCLDYIIMSEQPLSLLILAKICAHWVASGLPLLFISPLLGMIFQMQVDTILVMIVTLFFGTFALSLLGSIGASITISIDNSNILTSLLILPLAIPVLIFGARTIVLYQTGISASSGFYFLSAYCMFALSFAPYASASAIKVGLD